MSGKKEKKGEDQIYPHVYGIHYTDKWSEVLCRIDKDQLLEAVRKVKSEKGMITAILLLYANERIGHGTLYFRPYNKERDL